MIRTQHWSRTQHRSNTQHWSNNGVTECANKKKSDSAGCKSRQESENTKKQGARASVCSKRASRSCSQHMNNIFEHNAHTCIDIMLGKSARAAGGEVARPRRRATTNAPTHIPQLTKNSAQHKTMICEYAPRIERVERGGAAQQKN